jgi:glycosyltransferase involved in cell wall biosynthesis
MPEISVIVPLKNGEKTIAQCLGALTRQTWQAEDYEIIVVDDGSTDSSPETVSRYDVSLIRQKAAGPSAARNTGVRAARGALILFTDADCIVPQTWIEELVKPIRSGAYDGSVGRYVSPQQNWIARLIQLQLEERYSRMSQFDHVDFVNTGTAAFRKSVLTEDPFDTRFKWPGLEDLELSFRLSSQGCKIAFVETLGVEHRHPEKLFHYLRRRFFYAANSFLLYGKYPNKMVSDSSTPHLRRLQLVGLVVGLALLPFLPETGLVIFLGSQLLAGKFIWRAVKESLPLGLGALLFTFLGNLAFLLGLTFGFLFKIFSK